VQIRAADRVLYDVSSTAQIRSIHVAGTLAFAADRDTRLDVGLIKVQPGDDASESGFDCAAHIRDLDPAASYATLEVGSSAQPITPSHTARIRLIYVDGMDKESCPAIVACGGRMDFHGSPMSRTWTKLGADANAGDIVITLSEPITGWRVGDRVIVTATQRDRGQPAMPGPTPRNAADYKNTDGALAGLSPKGDPPLTEERSIRALAGAALTLDRPLAHHHLGSGPYRGEVANLSRNIVVESADPDGPRGHTNDLRDRRR
jgi:hypothetical protein